MNVGASLDLRMDDTPESFARHLTSLGLSHVEIRHSYLDTRPDQPEPAAFRALAERYGLTYTVHAPYTDCNPANLNERLRLAAADSLADKLRMPEGKRHIADRRETVEAEMSRLAAFAERQQP